MPNLVNYGDRRGASAGRPADGGRGQWGGARNDYGDMIGTAVNSWDPYGQWGGSPQDRRGSPGWGRHDVQAPPQGTLPDPHWVTNPVDTSTIPGPGEPGWYDPWVSSGPPQSPIGPRLPLGTAGPLNRPGTYNRVAGPSWQQGSFFTPPAAG